MKDVTVSWTKWSFWLERKKGERLLVTVEPEKGFDDVFVVTAKGELSGKEIAFKMWDARGPIEEQTANAVRIILDNIPNEDEDDVR